MLLLLLLAAWEPVGDKYGYTVERRPLPGVDFYEVRVRAHSTCTPEQSFAVAWNTPAYPSFVKYSKLIKILRDTGQERITYQQNSVPVVQDRDYTVRSWYEKDPKSGLIQVWWEAANDKGPPEQPGYTRIHKTGGSWTFEPVATGGTDITYVVASEAGGSVPAWIVRGAQTDAAPDFVRTIIKRAERR